MIMDKLLRNRGSLSAAVFAIGMMAANYLGKYFPFLRYMIFILVAVVSGSLFISSLGIMKGKRLAGRGWIKASAMVLETYITGEEGNLGMPKLEVKLEVYPEGGQPFTATLRKIISPADSGRISVGTMVQIRYDPSNPENITFDKSSGGVVSDVPAGKPFIGSLSELLDGKKGLSSESVGDSEADAEILRIRNTGFPAGSDKVIMEFRLEVRPAEGLPFKVDSYWPILNSEIIRLKKGGMVKVKYSPSGISNVTII